MCKISKPEQRIIPDDKFKCHFCECTVYAPKGCDKHVEICVNDVVLEILDSIQQKIPVYCDAFPDKLVTWYSNSTKTLFSN